MLMVESSERRRGACGLIKRSSSGDGAVILRFSAVTAGPEPFSFPEEPQPSCRQSTYTALKVRQAKVDVASC